MDQNWNFKEVPKFKIRFWGPKWTSDPAAARSRPWMGPSRPPVPRPGRPSVRGAAGGAGELVNIIRVLRTVCLLVYCTHKLLEWIVFQYIALRIIKIGLFPVSQQFRVIKMGYFQYLNNSRVLKKWVISSISTTPGSLKWIVFHFWNIPN